MNIGDYKISSKRIGKGGFSTVYLGEQKYTKELYAIKQIDVENIYKLNKNIKREIELHKKIKHRNIISLYDILYDDKIHSIYLILEYCKIGDFAKFQNKQPLKEVYIQKYIKDLSEGLKYLYKYNIIHRDLKPQNLLISNCGDIKISDFGFAKEYDNINNLKNTYCGSPLYMAPEILHYKKYDNKSDLWSVGIIIYEMITGKPPYHVKNFYQLIKLIDKENIILPTKFKSYISIELQKLLASLLVKEPNNRICCNDFFSNKWLKDPFLERENNLFDVDFNNKISFKKITNDSKDINIPNNKFCNSIETIATSLHSLDNIEHFNNQINFDIVFDDNLENSTESFYSAKESDNEDNEDNDAIEDNIIFSQETTKVNELKIAMNESDITKPIDIKYNLKNNRNVNRKTNRINNELSMELLDGAYDIVNKKDLSNPIDEEISLNLNSINYKLNNPFRRQSENNKFPLNKIFNNSYSILKESFDYLSSHNKSI